MTSHAQQKKKNKKKHSYTSMPQNQSIYSFYSDFFSKQEFLFILLFFCQHVSDED